MKILGQGSVAHLHTHTQSSTNREKHEGEGHNIGNVRSDESTRYESKRMSHTRVNFTKSSNGKKVPMSEPEFTLELPRMAMWT